MSFIRGPSIGDRNVPTFDTMNTKLLVRYLLQAPNCVLKQMVNNKMFLKRIVCDYPVATS